MGAAVGEVHAPVVDLQRYTAQRGDAVHQQQGVALAGTDGGDLVADSCRGLGVHHGDDLGIRMGVEEVLWVECPTPLGIHPQDRGTAAGGHIAHPLAEQAVDADHDRVAGPQHVHEGGLHASRTGGRHGEGERVGGAEDLTQPFVGLVQEGNEVRVQVAQHGTAEGLDDLRIGVPGTGAHEDAICV